MSKHSPFSPSAYAGWMGCPAFMQRNQGMEDTAGEAAKFGTECHEVFSKWVISGEVVKTGNSSTDENIMAKTGPAMVYVADLRKQGYTIQSEIRVDAGLAFPSLGAGVCDGTADIVAFHPETRHLIVADLKTGFMYVPADAGQLKIYAVGALTAMVENPPVKVSTVVIQEATDPPIRTWDTTPAELMKWGREEMVPAIKAGCEDSPLATPGEDACQWCCASGNCPEQAVSMFNKVPATADEVKTLAIPTMDTARLEDIFLAENLIVKTLKDCKHELYSRLMGGEKSEVLMLAPGRRSTTWTASNTRVEEVLRTKMRLPLRDAYTMKLKTPAQVRKMKLTKFARNRLESMMETTRGEPTMVRRTDKKEEFVPQMFEALEGTSTITFEDILK